MAHARTLVPLRTRIPTVFVRLATDEGEVAFRARWRRSALELQRMILYCIRAGRPIWFEDEWGHDVCFRADRVYGAMVDGRRAGAGSTCFSAEASVRNAASRR